MSNGTDQYHAAIDFGKYLPNFIQNDPSAISYWICHALRKFWIHLVNTYQNGRTCQVMGQRKFETHAMRNLTHRAQINTVE